MLKLSDLALRPDMQLGPMLVSPSRRLIEGPGGHAHLEPLIMQVFLLLLDARGKVVTRTELFDQCWGGVIVGDDSLNRAIASVRRIGARVAPGLFEVETIPRTGYRLTGEILRDVDGDPATASGDAPVDPPVSRRMVVGGAAAGLALTAGGLWWVAGRPANPRFDALMQRGNEALRLDDPGAARYFEQAAAVEPGNATSLGMLAYALANTAGEAPPATAGRTAQAAERAARRALDIDPKEPNALLARTSLQRGILDWLSREEEYRRILAIDPNNTLAMRSLGQFLHSVGRCGESLAVAERSLALEPLWPDQQARRALRLWVLGRTSDADRVSSRAMELWPSHRLVRLAQLMIYAFTGRSRAALALIDEEEGAPILQSPATASAWRASLMALEAPNAPSIAAAREENVEGAKATRGVAAWAILVLSALGELDSAFDIANGFLLGRGSVIVQPQAEAQREFVNNTGWRNTFGLFTPPTLAMRLDPRFQPLAKGLGLTDYWRRRGIGPDAFLFEA